ncbi:MAG TPA: hypothetical protein VHT91_06210 [Kofleriaceae bacterium]|jgi:hypothetical protein|nr:hypothetical protein [Kofleriaceae bacterium]
MSQQRSKYRYFTIQSADVPSQPSYPVWFATWSAKQSEYVWSKNRPDTTAGTTKTWTVGATDDADLPPGAIAVVASIDKCIDPPPLTVPIDATIDQFQAVLGRRLVQEGQGAKSLEIRPPARR